MRQNEPQWTTTTHEAQWATMSHWLKTFIICSCEKHEMDDIFLFKKVQHDIGPTMRIDRGLVIQSTIKYPSYFQWIGCRTILSINFVSQ